MVEEPDSENSLFSEPMKIADAFGLFGAAQQIDHLAPGFQIVEQQPDPLEVGDRLEVVEQMRLTAHDQLALVAFAARPAGKAGGDDLLGQLIEFGLACLARALDLGLDLSKGVAADTGIEEVCASISAEVGKPTGTLRTRFST